MDTITHALTGTTLSTVLKKFDLHAGKWVLIISSVIPDLDFVTRYWGMASYLNYHRGISHSFIGVAVSAVMLAAIFKVFFKKSPYPLLLLFGLIGGLIHIFMDLTNSYGTQIFLPFSSHRYGFDWVMIVDPYIFGLLLFGLVFILLKKSYSSRIALASLLLIFIYIGFKAVLHQKAFSLVKKYSLDNEKKIKFGAYPYFIPLSPFKWLGVIETKNTFLMGDIDLLKSREKFVRHEKIPETEVVKIAKNSRTAQIFLDFAKYPRLEVKKKDDKWEIVWYDLAFSYFDDKRFVCKIVLSEDNKILSESFSY
ncbi:MAG: metal-dependent hydrolase [candidate division Zixibacteria bacterium]|nr:metal-dependent hydrolase [candidate division Zixibacteria bacterium]